MFNHIWFFHPILLLSYLTSSISKVFLVTTEMPTSCLFTVEASFSQETHLFPTVNEYWWKGLSVGLKKNRYQYFNIKVLLTRIADVMQQSLFYKTEAKASCK